MAAWRGKTSQRPTRPATGPTQTCSRAASTAVTPPSILLELARTPIPEIRFRIIEAINQEDMGRVGAGFLWWHNLMVVPGRVVSHGGDTTYADWVGPWVRLDSANTPRNWIREVVPWAQMESKLGGGNPRDAQHAAYVFDADVFVTADRRYAACLDLVRHWAPTSLAHVHGIPAKRPIVEAIEEVIQ